MGFDANALGVTGCPGPRYSNCMGSSSWVSLGWEFSGEPRWVYIRKILAKIGKNLENFLGGLGKVFGSEIGELILGNFITVNIRCKQDYRTRVKVLLRGKSGQNSCFSLSHSSLSWLSISTKKNVILTQNTNINMNLKKKKRRMFWFFF